MSYYRKFLGALGSLALSFSLIQTAQAWTPTHRIETENGTLYLRSIDEDSVLFAFRKSEAEGLEDSLLWNGDFIQKFATGRTASIEPGETVRFGSGTISCEAVDESLQLRLEYQGVEERRSASFRFLEGEQEFPRVLELKAQSDHLYGLGEAFPQQYLGDSTMDWKGRIRHPGATPTSFKDDPIGVYGNSMTPLAGGNVGNATFPVLYMVSKTDNDLMLFLDNPAYSEWDFRADPWRVRLREGEFGGAISWGAESETLRVRYLDWTGRPPVPPRKAFGMWVSEYGYENWQELESKAKSLLEQGFPVDGFVLDLQWFGGIVEGSGDSSMGRLSFDLEHFPNPAQKIAELGRRGLGIIVIEESYIASNLDEFDDLAEREFLIRTPEESYKPQIIDRVPWWGIGSMLDYTNPKAAKYWHETKRLPLVEMGVMGHWTDLGEPEIFRHVVEKEGEKSYQTPIYHDGKTQLQANNFFALHWAKSIFEGYGEDGHEAGPRPLILGRTGTSGIQRYGASLWSGDIGTNWESLRSHYAAQGHMSYSGVDYFGSDVGGFYREAFKDQGGYDELYSRWFAAACLTDIPLRPHTMNLGNKYETAPDRVGDTASNLANLKLRYRLIPYLYSAAYAAHLTGKPVVSPLAMEDSAKSATSSGTLKRIGPDLVAQLVLEPALKAVTCSLPPGLWYDFSSGEAIQVTASGVKSATVDEKGRLVTPLFARAGSLIPLGPASSSEDQPERLELVIFPGSEASSRIYHDDGRSEAYSGGEYAVSEFRTTDWDEDTLTLTVKRVEGAYRDQLPEARDIVVQLASDRPVAVELDGKRLEGHAWRGFQSFVLPKLSLSKTHTLRFQRS